MQHTLYGSAPTYTSPLLHGDAGTAQTIAKIRGLVDDAWKDSYVNRTAIEILRSAGVDQYANDDARAAAIYSWVLANMYFVNDPVSKEALRPAAQLLEMKAGDCDDINAILLPSLLGTIGIETRFVTIASDARDPNSFSHIYSEALIGGAWVPIDAARPGAAYGTAPERFYRREWWSTTDDSHADYDSQIPGMAGRRLAGMNGFGPETQGSAFLAILVLIGFGLVLFQKKRRA